MVDKAYGAIALCLLSVVSVVPAFAASHTVAAPDAGSALVFGGDQIASTQQADGSAVLGGAALSATVGAGALQAARGNFGINLAAGIDNAQSNLLAVDAGAQQVSVRSSQSASLAVRGGAVRQQAALGVGALENAAGNIGVNLASGAGNLQQNGLLVR